MKKHQDLPWKQLALNAMFAHLNSFKPQRPVLFEHLAEVMDAKVCLGREALFTPQKVVNRSFYVYDGYVLLSKELGHDERQLLRIYGCDSIVSGKSFEARTASGLFVEALAGTRLLSVNYDQMRVVYRDFPETHELSRLILGHWDKMEMERVVRLNQEALPLVEQFYQQHPELLTFRKKISDAELGSYLLISPSALKIARTALLKSGRISLPVK